MLNVLLTVDVEIWCDGWEDLDRKFPQAFDRYIHGPTPSGPYGLPYQARMLQKHGLLGVFFVEPLFSGRFGAAPLAEVVGILADAGQEIQLHLHTEWVDEWPAPPFPQVAHKRQFLRQFSMAEQAFLVGDGVRRLHEAGAPPVNCFRAGSFGFNADTVTALRSHGIAFDSSYNATAFGPDSGVAPGRCLTDVFAMPGVTEVPMTVYDTGHGRLRHTQLGACSWPELERLLWQALEREQQCFVLLSHNFELLTPSKRRADPVVTRRFERLCAFLDRHRDQFRTTGFHDLAVQTARPQPPPLSSTPWLSARRLVEQTYRRAYR